MEVPTYYIFGVKDATFKDGELILEGMTFCAFLEGGKEPYMAFVRDDGDIRTGVPLVGLAGCVVNHYIKHLRLRGVPTNVPTNIVIGTSFRRPYDRLTTLNTETGMIEEGKTFDLSPESQDIFMQYLRKSIPEVITRLKTAGQIKEI